jgi:23S rRNA (cytosine1962-C5)-methyltransferase
VDISEEAVSRATENAKLNSFDNCRFIAANVFDYLREKQPDKGLYDVIILDPPAFAKNHDAVKSATRGYKEINLRAMKLLRPGGFLITCSCSQHMTVDLFNDMLLAAAIDANRELRIIEKRGQAKDHPYLLAAPETNYLKCFITQVR